MNDLTRLPWFPWLTIFCPRISHPQACFSWRSSRHFRHDSPLPKSMSKTSNSNKFTSRRKIWVPLAAAGRGEMKSLFSKLSFYLFGFHGLCHREQLLPLCATWVLALKAYLATYIAISGSSESSDPNFGLCPQVRLDSRKTLHSELQDLEFRQSFALKLIFT